MTSEQGAVEGRWRAIRPRLPTARIAVTYGNKSIGLLFNDEGLRLEKHLMSSHGLPRAGGVIYGGFVHRSQKPEAVEGTNLAGRAPGSVPFPPSAAWISTASRPLPRPRNRRNSCTAASIQGHPPPWPACSSQHSSVHHPHPAHSAHNEHTPRSTAQRIVPSPTDPLPPSSPPSPLPDTSPAPNPPVSYGLVCLVSPS